MNASALLLFLAASPVPTPEVADAGVAAPAAPLVPVPTQTEARRVLDYYHQGKAQGPVLIDLKLCTKVDTAKDSPTKSDCLDRIEGPVKTNTNVHGWTVWLVPEGGNYEDVTIQFVYQGQVRNTQDLRLNNAGRSRAWRTANLSKAGTWEIKVVRGDKELAAQSVIVKD